MDHPPGEATARLASDVLRFAQDKLGPASERLQLFLKGYSLPKIASDVGLSHGAARMALGRAVRRTRRMT
jgi:hypothetical protein